MNKVSRGNSNGDQSSKKNSKNIFEYYLLSADEFFQTYEKCGTDQEAFLGAGS